MAAERLAQDLEAARWAVERWAGFPVERVPRPLVFIGPAARSDGGFRSGAAKEAFRHGLVAAHVAVPEAVIAALAETDDPPPAGLEPLVITAAQQSEAEFWTDRGRRRLPAWQLECDDGVGPLWVPAPEALALTWSPGPPTRRPPGSRHMHFTAVASSDERTLSVTFTGAPPEFADYPRAEVIESDRAVAVVPVEEDLLPPGTIRIAIGRERQVQGRLVEPLGARVLVDLDGSPCEVTPA